MRPGVWGPFFSFFLFSFFLNLAEAAASAASMQFTTLLNRPSIALNGEAICSVEPGMGEWHISGSGSPRPLFKLTILDQSATSRSRLFSLFLAFYRTYTPGLLLFLYFFYRKTKDTELSSANMVSERWDRGQ